MAQEEGEETGIVIEAPGSHLWPGTRARLRGPDGAADGPCLVEFADGAAALGRLQASGSGHELILAPHVTARGTRIPARSWAVAVEGAALHVIRRLG